MFPSLKKYVSCRRHESSILGFVPAGVGLAFGLPVEVFTGLVPVSVASSGTFGGCKWGAIDSNETTEVDLEGTEDAAGILALQETMRGTIGIKDRVEE